MVGNTYGELTVIEEHSPTNKDKCVCQCSCGKIVEKRRGDVRHGNTKSCGCLKKKLAQEHYTKDLTGQRFGKLVAKEIVRDHKESKRDGAYWLCVCDCGNEKVIHRSKLQNGTISCGCQRQETWRSNAPTLMGRQFGNWTVLKDFVSKEDNRCMAQCSCGQISYLDRYSLTSGGTKGCHKCLGERLSRESRLKRIGEKNGKLLIIDIDKDNNYICQCDCGTVKVVGKGLWNKGVQSCGCYKSELTRQRFTEDLTGKRFGGIVALEVIYRENKSPKWLCQCDCGNKFETYGSTLKNGSGMCPKCWNEHNRGENNPSWNPNLTDEDRDKNRCTQEGNQEDWRKQVYERDNYTCQCCGQRGGRLNAHHLDGYNWCKERRFDISNGVTLCEGCHKDFHKQYKYKNNTEQQFREFMDRRGEKEWQEQP